MNAQEREALRESSQAGSETGGFYLAGAKILADGLAGGEGKAERIDCKIEKFRVTKIYNIPIWWDGTEEERKSKILYSEKGFVAVITDDIEEYLKKKSRYGQYVRDPRLREVCKKINESHSKKVFVIIEEEGETKKKEFNQGECWKNPRVGEEDTIMIFKTTDGDWPGGNENIKAERVVLAAIKLETEATHNIKQEARCFCCLQWTASIGKSKGYRNRGNNTEVERQNNPIKKGRRRNKRTGGVERIVTGRFKERRIFQTMVSKFMASTGGFWTRVL